MFKFKPGISFADFVVREQKSRPARIATQNVVSGVDWLPILLIVAGATLVIRLVYLQLLAGGRYRILADENRIKQIKLVAPRGVIYDRHGKVIPKNPATAHVVGYLGKVATDEVGLLKDYGGKYDPDAWIGRSGLEEQYEEQLRGVDGGKLVEVGSMGETVRELGQKNPILGQDLRVSLDSDLQQVALEALGGKKGAVVVSNPQTGEILVLVSSPSFDPNDIGKSLTDKRLPLLNRAIGGIYAPGSIFKMISAAAAISENKVSPNFSYEDTGVITVGSFRYTNWFFTQYGRTEGVIGWSKALARSTDTFFYKIGEMTGAENITAWAKKFGLGQKTGIDIPGEVAGLIPDPKIKQWFLGNTYHLAIGQEDLLTTPIQINQMTNILASNGKKCKLHLLSMTNDSMTQCPDIGIASDALRVIHQGMIGACSEGGTAYPLFNFQPQIACKTGTAEFALPSGKFGAHAWLTAFAPADNPEVSVTVLVEAGGEGSRAAAPIARKILAKYFGAEDKYNYSSGGGVGE